MTAQEAALWTDISRHEAEVYRAYPEASNFEAFEKSRRDNPARIEALLQERQRSDAARQQLAALSTNRQNAQARVAQGQREQIFNQHDAEFNKWLGATHPNYSKGARRNELTQAVKSYLREDLEMDDRAIEFHYKTSGQLRSLAAQKALAQGAMFKLMQASAKNLANKRVPPPPVQRPGTYRPTGADAEDSVRALERQLESATGERALRIATKLTQAKRAAGL
jgi:hypothetical protein